MGRGMQPRHDSHTSLSGPLTTQTRPTRLTVTRPGPPSGEGTVSEKKKYTLSSAWSELSGMWAAITNRGSGQVTGMLVGELSGKDYAWEGEPKVEK